MTNHPLEDAWRRLDWAKRQVGELERAIAKHFAQNPYTTIIDRESQPGRMIYRAELINPLPKDLQRHVAEFTGHLRPPLDYAVVAAATKLGITRAEKLVLPIADSERAFEAEMKKRKIEAANTYLAFFLRFIKPYKGPNDLIFALHEISKTDKHRELAAIGMAAGGVSLNIEDATFIGPCKLGTLPVWEPARNGFVLLDVGEGSEFKGSIQAQCHVALSKLEGFERVPVTHVFVGMVNAVDNILKKFEQQFFSNPRPRLRMEG